MNIIEFNPHNNNNLAFCIVDNTHSMTDQYHKELVKNISDFTISNIVSKKYDVYQGLNVDELLEHVANKGIKHCFVFSTGTEFINGRTVFDEIERLIQTDYVVYGHILDRKEAYYELHHQAFLINLDIYNKLNRPRLGKTELGSSHTKTEPVRSTDNIHDDYTPRTVSMGTTVRTYSHKMHGHNLVNSVLEAGYTIKAFPEQIRESKIYYYPENNQLFLEKMQYLYARYNYCLSTFVHSDHTDIIGIDGSEYEQVITSASGKSFVGPNVIMFDYNQKALEYYKNECSQTIHVDLLGIDTHKLIVNPEKKTLVNLTNIFNYEGTMAFSSLKYRLFKENQLLKLLPENWDVLFTQRSCMGFCDTESKDIVNISSLKKPTWHMNGDWED